LIKTRLFMYLCSMYYYAKNKNIDNGCHGNNHTNVRLWLFRLRFRWFF
jgi:hypothetical protein